MEEPIVHGNSPHMWHAVHGWLDIIRLEMAPVLVADSQLCFAEGLDDGLQFVPACNA